jgi:hypothetical protein
MQQLIRSQYLTDVAPQEIIALRPQECFQMYVDNNGVDFLLVEDNHTWDCSCLHPLSLERRSDGPGTLYAKLGKSPPDTPPQK